MEVKPEEIQLYEKIGDGNFAEVFRGSFRGAIVAVKRWRSALPSGEGAALQRELEIGSGLTNHPTLIHVYAYCNNPVMLIMEYFECKELYDIIHDPSVRYNWMIVRVLAIRMAMALEHMHSKNLIHRDVKSPNVLIDRNWNLKVCDFGQSRVKDVYLKHTGGRGTVHWTAPEMLRGDPYDQSVDVYSYGIIVWEMITRQAPFAHYQGNHITVALAVSRGERLSIPATVPARIQVMLNACFGAPHERPTAQQLIDFWNDDSVLEGRAHEVI